MYHILIVEDNRDIAVLYQRALFQYQHTVAENAENAIQKLKSTQFDMVILDMHLPEESGLKVLEFIRIQKQDKKTKVMVISADEMYRDICRGYGIQGWMTKPIEVDILMENVAHQLPS